MSIATNAFISLDQIVCSNLLRTGKTIHSYMRLVKYGADCVRELQLHHVPMVHHTLLTKETNESWFILPPGYTDYVSVNMRTGQYFHPIGVGTANIMPMPRSNGAGEFNDEFSGAFNKDGSWTNWINPTLASSAASFSGGSFSANSYNTTGSPTSGTVPPSNCQFMFPYGGFYGWFWSDHYDSWGQSTGRYFGLGDGVRSDTVVVNPEKGIIMCPNNFPSNELYLVWTGVGTADSMTHIPLRAQATVESYMQWQRVLHKRGALKWERDDAKSEHYNDLRILRASSNPMSVTDFERILQRNYGISQKVAP